MSFSAAFAFSSAFCLCAGAFCACLLFLLVAWRKHSNKETHIFIASCLLLSALFVIAASLLIFAFSSLQLYVNDSYYRIYSLVLFLTGFLCALFWKIMIPLILVFYILISAVTGIVLYGIFGSQVNLLQLSIQQNKIVFEGKEYARSDSDYITFELYSLPPELLLPLPRVWYLLSGREGENLPLQSFLQNKPFSSVLTAYMTWCLSSHQTVEVSVPDHALTTGLYSCSVMRNGEQMSFQLRRDL